MNLYVKQKVFSLNNKFNVYDAEGNTIYDVQSELVSIKSKTYIYDLNGEQVAYIYRKVFSFMPKYFIEFGQDKAHELKGKLSFVKEVFVCDDLDIKIVGNFLQYNYTIAQKDKVIATIHQKLLSWGDTYELSVEDGIDEKLILAFVICIDMIHQINRSTN